MADGTVAVPPDSTGKKIATAEFTRADTTVVEIQRVELVDASEVQQGTAAAPFRVDPTGTTTQPVSGSLSLGTSTGKTNVHKTGTLATTSSSADQVVLTYTVTAGKTFYLLGLDIGARITTAASTATNFGTASLESPSGTKLNTWDLNGAGLDRVTHDPAEPIPIAAGTVIRIVCTPSATTSYTWRANLIGYEK